MIQLLNRFAWILSITLALSIANIVDDRHGSEWIFTFLVILGILKFFLLSKAYIRRRVSHFADVALRKSSSLHGDHVSNTKAQDEEDPHEELTHMSVNSQKDFEKQVRISDNYEDNWVSGEDNDDTGEHKSTPSQKSAIESDEPLLGDKVGNYVSNFFSENLLAKIGGIMVFLGVLFLLSLIWGNIPGLLKIILGFMIGILVYLTGVRLDKKGLENEGRILLGIGLLINYAVILSGRYIIGDSDLEASKILSETMTFFFLILNTVIAVLTSLLYKSSPLLVFSLFCAYLNPFLVGGKAEDPYVLTGYAIIVSAGVLYLGYIRKYFALIVMAFCFGNLLIYVAPMNAEVHWVVKFIASSVLSLASLLSAISIHKKEKLHIEILFGASFFIVGFMGLMHGEVESLMAYVLITFVSLAFMLASYIFARSWPFLYSIGSIGGALLLSAFTDWSNTQMLFISIIGITIYLIMNIASIFMIPFQGKSGLKNIVIGSVAGVAYAGFSLFAYSLEHLSKMELGLGYFVLALLYFFVGYMIVQKKGIEEIKNNKLETNTLYNFLAISTSLFSIAIALVFSETAWLVSIIWLVESTIILYFYTKVKDIKIMLASLIMMILGLLKFVPFIYGIIDGKTESYLIISPLLIIIGVLSIGAVCLKSLKRSDNQVLFAYNIVHTLGYGLVLFAAYVACFESGKDLAWPYTFIVLAAILSGFGYLYSQCKNTQLRLMFCVTFILVLGWHYLHVIGRDFSEYLQLQYVATIVLSTVSYIFYSKNKPVAGTGFLLVGTAIYLFLITSYYVFDIFQNTFSVTLYWGIISFLLLWQGIGRDRIQLRTLGLYLVAIMCLKILFVDIGASHINGIMKVVAFIAVGVMLIIISTMYSRKYGNNLKGEFQLSNIFGGDIDDASQDYVAPDDANVDEEDLPLINKAIKDIDVSDIKSVEFSPKGGKTFNIKAQNLLKITKLILGEKNTATFKARELMSEYNHILDNYQSEFHSRDLNRIESVIHDFVQSGGSVKLKKHDS